MKRNTRFNLRMTEEEMEELFRFAGEGKRSEFIRKAIKARIKTEDRETIAKKERIKMAADGSTWIDHGQYRDKLGIVRDVGYDPLEGTKATK